MKIVPVSINWQGKKAAHLPSGIRYITVGRFIEDKNWPDEAWSIVLEFDIPPSQQGNPSNAVAHFLVSEAPQERLSKGNIFELYEGKDLVGRVEIN